MAKRAHTPSDIRIEYAVEDATLTEAMKAKVARRMRRLAGGHRDIAGAAVAIENVRGTKRNASYRCRLVIYIKPAPIVAVHKADKETTALTEALDAAERQVRGQRERIRDRHRGKYP